jgi:hypothetical protein
LLYVSQILQARRGFLIPNQVVTRKHKGGHSSKQRLYTIRPRLLKLNSVNVSYYVDPYRRQANLKDRSFPTQIISG